MKDMHWQAFGGSPGVCSGDVDEHGWPHRVDSLKQQDGSRYDGLWSEGKPPIHVQRYNNGGTLVEQRGTAFATREVECTSVQLY